MKLCQANPFTKDVLGLNVQFYAANTAQSLYGKQSISFTVFLHLASRIQIHKFK